jgi:HD-GYP domain-containing protein (c-di-GMP phosphodiesterase class II)
MSIVQGWNHLNPPSVLLPARAKTATVSPSRVPSKKPGPQRSRDSYPCLCGLETWPGCGYQDDVGRQMDGCTLGSEVLDAFPPVLHTVVAFIKALHLRDSETACHVRRVTHLARLLGQQLGLPRTDLLTLQVGAMLHDVGKLSLPDAILRKPGPLSMAEMSQVRQHPLNGVDLLQFWFPTPNVLQIVRHHHERWDGAGYPDGLSGEQIPYFARIVAVADAFDAMTADRPYRRGLPPRIASDLLIQSAGTHFDPAIVAAFFRLPSVLWK